MSSGTGERDHGAFANEKGVKVIRSRTGQFLSYLHLYNLATYEIYQKKMYRLLILLA